MIPAAAVRRKSAVLGSVLLLHALALWALQYGLLALGLAVAIPAVLGYNAQVRGNKSVLTKLNRFAHDLYSYFVTGSRVGQA